MYQFEIKNGQIYTTHLSRETIMREGLAVFPAVNPLGEVVEVSRLQVKWESFQPINPLQT